ncbi:MAG TPA: ABC transporter permease [Rhizomicrobium sp.]|jgi:putative ABC transport system permease protein|nr:ABC transporter permease [Rhizomicrobium sp.]
MKYLPLVLAALTRRKLRTALTLLSVIAAFTLFGLSMGTDASFRRMADATNPKVVEIQARFASNLTEAMGQQIAAMPNVATVASGGNVFGYYRDPKTFAYAIMVGDEAGWPNAPISPAQWAEWRVKPDGVFLSRIIAALWGLKKGDIFTIIDSRIARADGGHAWRFQVLDVLADTPYRPFGFSYGSYQYFKMSRPATDQPKVGSFQAVVTDASRADDTALAIDARFANSAIPTRSRPILQERSDAATATVNVASVTRRVALVGLFIILMLNGHGMAQSVRERLGEFAVLKTVGYSDAGVTALVFAEALAPVLLGAILGLGTAALLSARIQALLAAHGLYMPEPYLSATVIGEALAAAVLLAFLTVALPARQLRRLDVAAILAGRS